MPVGRLRVAQGEIRIVFARLLWRATAHEELSARRSTPIAGELAGADIDLRGLDAGWWDPGTIPFRAVPSVAKKAGPHRCGHSSTGGVPAEWLWLVGAEPHAGHQRGRVAHKPDVGAVVGGAGFAGYRSTDAGLTHGTTRATINDALQQRRDQKGVGRFKHLGPGRARMAPNHASELIFHAFHEIRLHAQTAVAEWRVRDRELERRDGAGAECQRGYEGQFTHDALGVRQIGDALHTQLAAEPYGRRVGGTGQGIAHRDVPRIVVAVVGRRPHGATDVNLDRLVFKHAGRGKALTQRLCIHERLEGAARLTLGAQCPIEALALDPTTTDDGPKGACGGIECHEGALRARAGATHGKATVGTLLINLPGARRDHALASDLRAAVDRAPDAELRIVQRLGNHPGFTERIEGDAHRFHGPRIDGPGGRPLRARQL